MKMYYGPLVELHSSYIVTVNENCNCKTFCEPSFRMSLLEVYWKTFKFVLHVTE